MKKKSNKIVFIFIGLPIFFFMIWLSFNIFHHQKQINEIQRKIDLITDKTIKEEEFIRKRIDYVSQYTKNKIVAYRILKSVKTYSDIFKVDPDLVLSIIKNESKFDSNAISYKGAIGLMQILPETGELMSRLLNKFGYNLQTIDDNIELGVAFLSILLEYNSTEVAIKKYYAGRAWSIPDAHNYYTNILAEYVNLKNNTIE